ncbi:Uncharacterised protein [uncultured archaeon]|nr:Uncharacterised protein [uncultured archaeon]
MAKLYIRESDPFKCMRLVPILLIAIMLVGVCGAVAEFNYTKLAEVQQKEGNYSKWVTAADISNASADLRPKTSTGNYDSTKYDIPIGPYKVSFELRTPLSFFDVDNISHEEATGSGKDYYKAFYDIYKLNTGNVSNYTIVDETTAFDGTGNSTTVKNSPDQIKSEVTFRLAVHFVHYKGPSSYQATAPSNWLERLYHIPQTWDDGIPMEITIDGKKGIAWNDVKWSKSFKVLAERYTYQYDLDPSTIIVITASGKWDYDKDLSLFAETFHATKR